ncbi:P-loop containing nucleoside triphosphate hydrolase protein, partial [Lentinula lateritia]
MFSGAHDFEISHSNFIVRESHHQTEDIQMAIQPPGYIRGMTDCPRSTLAFTGRNEILESLEKFFLSTTVPTNQKVFLLYGLGGVGKTQTALKFKQRLSSKKRLTKIYFIKANTEQLIQASYFDIAIDNGIVQAQDWHAGIHWLHSNQESWFIIMDKADDPKIPLTKYLPSCGHGNIIITSRNPDLQDVTTQSLEVQNMVPTEGIQLLSLKAVGGSLTAEQEKKVAQIAKRLHYFPLALVHAGAYIRQRKCLSTYLERLQNLRRQILEKEIPQSLDGYSLSIYATWKLSWDELSDQAKALLSVCAHLHYEKIPRLLFERAMKNIDNVYMPLGPSNAVDEARIILSELATFENVWDLNQFDEIVIEANSYSLLQVADEGLYEIHPLVQ